MLYSIHSMVVVGIQASKFMLYSIHSMVVVWVFTQV